MRTKKSSTKVIRVYGEAFIAQVIREHEAEESRAGQAAVPHSWQRDVVPVAQAAWKATLGETSCACEIGWGTGPKQGAVASTQATNACTGLGAHSWTSLGEAPRDGLPPGRGLVEYFSRSPLLGLLGSSASSQRPRRRVLSPEIGQIQAVG